MVRRKPIAYAVYTQSAEDLAASYGGSADDYADWYNTEKEAEKAAVTLAKQNPGEEVKMLLFVNGEAEDFPTYYKWSEHENCVESYTHEVRCIYNGDC